ncbi:MAG: TolC family protein, partial [Pseudomonadales bacterium]
GGVLRRERGIHWGSHYGWAESFLRIRLWCAWCLLLPVLGWAEAPQIAPLLIEEAVAKTIAQNPTLSEVQARYQAMSEIPSQRGTLPDPVLGLNAMNLPTDSFNVGQEPMTQTQIGLSQVLPFPGKLSLAKTISEYEALAAGSSVEEVRLKLIRDAKSRWWQLFYLDRTLDVVASNQDLLRQFVQVAKTKYEVGDGLQQDTLLAQLELSKLFDQEIRLQAIRDNQAIQLNVLMDESPELPIVLPEKVSTELPKLRPETILYDQAHTLRPLLDVEANYINAAEARLKLARKQYYPDFKLGVTYGDRRGDNPLPIGGPREDFLSVMLSVNLPIYHKRRLDREVSQRRLELRQSNESLRDQWGVVRAEISSAATDYDEARKLFELFDTGIIPQARQTVASMLAGYQVSEVDFLNLVGSQVTLLNYEVQYWQALSSANQALARLTAAVGEDDVIQ